VDYKLPRSVQVAERGDLSTKTESGIHTVPRTFFSEPRRLDFDFTTRYKGDYGEKVSKMDWELANLVTTAKPLRGVGLRRYGPEHKWVRIAGVAGAAGIGSLLYNDKAQAGGKEKIVGEVIESGAKKFFGRPSSTAAKLIGSEFKGGIIADVRAGLGNMRYIILEDGVSYPITKDVLHDLTKKVGTEKYIGAFTQDTDAESRLTRAYKSLQHHAARGHEDESIALDFYAKYVQQLNLAGSKVPSLSLVESKGKFFTMPKEYVDLLVKEGANINLRKELK
jgi:hypothetical protein